MYKYDWKGVMTLAILLLITALIGGLAMTKAVPERKPLPVRVRTKKRFR